MTRSTNDFQALSCARTWCKAVKGNAIVPSYVLEFLLGQYCATDDEASIQSGIETVKDILRKHYVHRNEAGLIRSNIREKGRWKVIDKISVDLNDRQWMSMRRRSQIWDQRRSSLIPDTVKAHPKLLVSGVWCIADVEYEHSEDKRVTPWISEEPEADPAFQVRLRCLSDSPRRLCDRGVDRSPVADGRFQSRTVWEAAASYCS